MAIKNIKVGGRTEKGWTENVVSLDKYCNSDFISIVFLGITGGYMDVIYLDNISVRNPNAGGIGTVTFDYDQEMPIYDIRGIEVNTPTLPGIYIQGNQKIIKR